ncbi:MAG: pentapeptide repeat-containing protein, partial [Dolichospermum sp.]
MANQQHLNLLRSGAVIWIEWRNQNPQIEIDLSGANLLEENLRGANLAGVNFHKVNLAHALLVRTNFN